MNSPAQSSRSNRSKFHWRTTSGAFAVMIALGAAVLMGAHSESLPGASSQPPAAVASANDLSAAFRYASEKVLPSVVTIRTEMTAVKQTAVQAPQGIPEDMQPFLKRFFGDDFKFDATPRQQPRKPHREGMGSGVIIDASGIILTNNHVVSGGNRVVVTLHDGREFEAIEVKTDPKTDIAVVRIEGAGTLPAARIGNSDTMEIGDWVLAVGAPFGLDKTVTAGIISAKSRGVGITEREEFLQTDAAINPGNSGGPLVNLRGEIIGINTAISTRGGGNDGIGFAVPINLATWISNQLVESGTVKRAFLGVGIQKVTSDLSKQFGLSTVHGAVVTDVRSGTAAADAGLQTGDVIVEFDGHAIDGPRQLQNHVERAAIGKPHKVVIIRDGQRKTVEVTLQQMPQTLSASDSPAEATQHSQSEKLGIGVANLSDDVAEQLGLTDRSGVVIVSVTPGSAADGAGLQEGMVISRVGQTKVTSIDEFNAAIESADLEQGILLLVRTQNGSRFVVVKSA